MSGWAYSHERDTPALAATAAKVQVLRRGRVPAAPGPPGRGSARAGAWQRRRWGRRCQDAPASKAAAHSITEALRAELRDRAVTVLGAYPGGIDTDMLAGVEAPKAPPGAVAARIIAAL